MSRAATLTHTEKVFALGQGRMAEFHAKEAVDSLRMIVVHLSQARRPTTNVEQLIALLEAEVNTWE